MKTNRLPMIGKKVTTVSRSANKRSSSKSIFTKLGTKGLLAIVAGIVLLAGGAAAMMAVQANQDLRQEAAGQSCSQGCNPGEHCDMIIFRCVPNSIPTPTRGPTRPPQPTSKPTSKPQASPTSSTRCDLEGKERCNTSNNTIEKCFFPRTWALSYRCSGKCSTSTTSCLPVGRADGGVCDIGEFKCQSSSTVARCDFEPSGTTYWHPLPRCSPGTQCAKGKDGFNCYAPTPTSKRGYVPPKTPGFVHTQ